MIKILIVDDNESIHNDFKKVLQGKSKDKLRNVEMALFGDDDPDFENEEPVLEYDIDDAFQGEESIEMVNQAKADGNPYAMIFMDVRMPPGMDGIQASARIWEEHPDIELVICTAHSDYSWGEMVKEIGASDKLQFLRKPFDMVTVQQMALACVKKYEAKQEEENRLERLRSENKRQKETQRSLAQVSDEIIGLVSEVRKEMVALESVARQESSQLADEIFSRTKMMGESLTQMVSILEKSTTSLQHTEG